MHIGLVSPSPKKATRRVPRARVPDSDSLYQLGDYPEDDDLEFVAHGPAIDEEEQATTRGSGRETDPSLAQEPEGKSKSTISEAIPTPREVAGVIDIAESPSHTESLFDEAQAVKKKSNEMARAAEEALNMLFDGVDMGVLEDYSRLRCSTMKASIGLRWKSASLSSSSRSKSGIRTCTWFSASKNNEALKDLPILRDELEKAQNEALSVNREHAELVEKVQENISLIDQLQAEMNELKTLTVMLRSRMDLLASKNKAIKEKLALVKDQLRVAKDKADKWSRLNDELREQLDSTMLKRDDLDREYNALKSKLDSASIDCSEVEEMLSQYKTDVEIAEARLITKAEFVKRLSRRETLEKIQFDLSAEIEEAKRLEAEAKEQYKPEGPEGSGAKSSFGKD
ncbi:uncharacterized protein [Nicotiana tomentosiformis]|uniref:uncharacterized protein n=1 Tax=Nicotiana tomentosiformis TaxID=4098 RepID=UPI00388C8AB0